MIARVALVSEETGEELIVRETEVVTPQHQDILVITWTVRFDEEGNATISDG